VLQASRLWFLVVIEPRKWAIRKMLSLPPPSPLPCFPVGETQARSAVFVLPKQKGCCKAAVCSVPTQPTRACVGARKVC